MREDCNTLAWKKEIPRQVEIAWGFMVIYTSYLTTLANPMMVFMT